MSTTTKMIDNPVRIAVFGAGNIGSRLLQSVAAIDLGPDAGTMEINVVEPMPQAREVATERFHQAVQGTEKTLVMVDGAERLSGAMDLAIVSTDARNRLSAMKALLANTAPKRLLLEKFLFTKAADYREAATLIETGGIAAWVNCPRAEWPEYKKLKTELEGESLQALRVVGNDWGLACNGIHFLALAEFLTNSPVASLYWPKVEKVTEREAKRAGYKELIGTLEGKTESGLAIQLASHDDPSLAMSVEIETDKRTFKIAEVSGSMEITEKDVTATRDFAMTHVSQMAHAFESMLLSNATTLPDYTSSVELHLKAMEAMNLIFHNEENSELECPVT